MWAILGGLGAAVSWAVTSLTAARASRLIGSYSTLAWVMLTGLAVVAPVALAQGKPEGLDATSVGWLVVAGLSNVGGLLLIYTGFVSYAIGARHGIAVTAVLASQFAALAAIGAAIFWGERLGRLGVIGIAVIAVGVAVVSALSA